MAELKYSTGNTPEGRREFDLIAEARARNRAAIIVEKQMRKLGASEYKTDLAPVDMGLLGVVYLPRRMPVDGFDPSQTPYQAVYGHGPGYGPERLADEIEGYYGTLEDQPSWANKEEFVKATRDQAQSEVDNRPSGMTPYTAGEEAYRKNRYLMHPRRLDYMQHVGRFVDLLRGLRAKDPPGSRESWGESLGMDPNRAEHPHPTFDPALEGSRSYGAKNRMYAPSVALYYWDKSNLASNPDAIRTRTDFDDPNYARFAGWDKAASEFIANPMNPIARYLHAQEMIPSAIAYSTEGHGGLLGGLSTAVGSLAPYGTGGAAVSSVTPQPEQNSGEAWQRSKNLFDFRGKFMLGENPVLDLPSLQDSATPEQVDAHGEAYKKRLIELLQMQQHLAPPPDQNAVNDVWHAIQRAIPNMEPFPLPDTPPTDASPVFADIYGIGRSALDGTLIAGLLAGLPARMANQGLARATAAELSSQMKPELAFGGAMNLAMQEPRTWFQYLFKGAPSVPLDEAARAEAHRKMEFIQRDNPLGLFRGRDIANGDGSWTQ